MKKWLKITLILVVLAAIIVFIATFTRCIGCKDSLPSPDLTESQLNHEINNIFAIDDLYKIAIYPSRKIILKKGSELSPLGLSIRNTNNETTTFNYALEFAESYCGIKPSSANDLIALRRTGSTTIEANSEMVYPVLLEFRIPEDFPSCLIAYDLIVTDYGGNDYESMPITVEIIENNF